MNFKVIAEVLAGEVATNAAHADEWVARLYALSFVHAGEGNADLADACKGAADMVKVHRKVWLERATPEQQAAMVLP